MGEARAGHRPRRQRVWALALAVAALAGVWLAPTPGELPAAGHAMLAVLAFAVVLWITEAVDYAVSAALVVVAMTLLLGFSSDPARPGQVLGTSQALSVAIGGFSNRALALVVAALFFSVAMRNTGLDRRIALTLLSRAGAGTGRLVAGIVAVVGVLSLFMPSATARIACIAPIVLGIGRAMEGERRGGLAGLMMIAAAHAGSLWNAAIKTGDGQNMIAVGLMWSMLGDAPSWALWFAAGAPLALAGSLALYGLMRVLLPDGFRAFSGGTPVLDGAGPGQGPVSTGEKKLIVIALALLMLWSTGGILHSFDSATVTVIAVTLMFLPGIGILSWHAAQAAIPWGTIALFGAGIGLGSALLKYQSAGWLAGRIVAFAGLQSASPLVVLMVLSAFLMLLHLGFSSSAALSSAMIPIVIGVLQQVGTPAAGIVGTTMLLQFTVSFGFILPVNSPHNLLAYATETYSARDFIRVGVALSLVMLALQLVFALTWWRWLGIL